MGVLDFYQLHIGKILLFPGKGNPPFGASVVCVYGIAVGSFKCVVVSWRGEQKLFLGGCIQEKQPLLSFVDP